MRISVLFLATALTACTGTEGDLLRSTGDAGRTDEPAVGPPPVSASSWQIQLSGALDTTVDAHLYTVDTGTPVSTIAGLHAEGRVVLCYFSAGTRENFRNDAMQFPSAAIGAPLDNYPDENWLDVRDATVRSIMSQRIVDAAAAGCDGIHPSGIAFQSMTGFPLTPDDSMAFATWLAATAHARFLSIGLVEGDAAFAQALVANFDWTVVWDCTDTQCAAASPFLQAKKAGFLVDTRGANRATQVCAAAKALGLSAIMKNPQLDAFRVGCP